MGIYLFDIEIVCIWYKYLHLLPNILPFLEKYSFSHIACYFEVSLCSQLFMLGLAMCQNECQKAQEVQMIFKTCIIPHICYVTQGVRCWCPFVTNLNFWYIFGHARVKMVVKSVNKMPISVHMMIRTGKFPLMLFPARNLMVVSIIDKFQLLTDFRELQGGKTIQNCLPSFSAKSIYPKPLNSFCFGLYVPVTVPFQS